MTQLTFASMIRRGFLADENATTEVVVTVSDKPAITHQVPVMTPGDVVGIPARQVIRCSPANGLVDAEPNYLATIELASADLPWLFSRKPATGPILPWIALAVIDVTDLAQDPLSASPIGTQLTIAAAQLPNAADAWMWAHGQQLDGAHALSRLVSSRRLVAQRRYLACVVPVFAAGRIAGLGGDPGAARTSMELAWDPAAGDITLPVYAFWRFGTGPAGDFESLVERLHGVPLPSELGARKLYLDAPNSGLPNPDGAEVALQVALRPPDTQLDPIEPLVGPSYVEALRARLVDAGYDTSLLDAGPQPVVGPPVYGQLAAGATATAANLSSVAPPWVREANLDPRMRIAAGLGGEVVRQNQERYVEEAWRQVGDVLGANQLRRRGEFSLAASAKLHRTWIAKLSSADLVTSTAPVHARMFVADDLTLTGRLRQSPLPPSIVSVEYRRLTRTRGASAWRTAVGPDALAARSATPQPLQIKVPLDAIERMVAPSQVWGVAAAPAILGRLEPGLDQTGMTAANAAARLDASRHLVAVDFAIHRARAVETTERKAATVIVARQIVAADAVALPQTALSNGFDALRAPLVAALDPSVTIVRMVNHQISALSADQAAVLGDIMTAPDLSEPTYQALAAISHDWLLPGIDALSADTTTLVESNRAFISAFLVGMNHEVARMLRWREYPTDQRGTYCRQFWPHRDRDDPFELAHPLHASDALTLEALGAHVGEVASPLVLVVKGEVVRRYPGMLVTAARTKTNGAGRALDSATELQPEFMARLEPDVLLVGFTTLSADAVRAAGDDASTAWWFFFAEHFTEPRFGLDEAAASSPLADWNDATWSDAVLDAGRLGPQSFPGASLPKSRPGTPVGPSYAWSGTSSSIAWILLQAPFRRGVRATDLLPPRTPPQ